MDQQLTTTEELKTTFKKEDAVESYYRRSYRSKTITTDEGSSQFSSSQVSEHQKRLKERYLRRCAAREAAKNDAAVDKKGGFYASLPSSKNQYSSNHDVMFKEMLQPSDSIEQDSRNFVQPETYCILEQDFRTFGK